MGSCPEGVADTDLQLSEHRWPKPLLWWLSIISVLITGWVIVACLEPAGFDRCEAAPTPGAQAAQRAVAAGSVIVTTGLSVWRLNRWWLATALMTTGLAAAGWLVLLRGGQHCGEALSLSSAT
jgi:hypothetical protein